MPGLHSFLRPGHRPVCVQHACLAITCRGHLFPPSDRRAWSCCERVGTCVCLRPCFQLFRLQTCRWSRRITRSRYVFSTPALAREVPSSPSQLGSCRVTHGVVMVTRVTCPGGDCFPEGLRGTETGESSVALRVAPYFLRYPCVGLRMGVRPLRCFLEENGYHRQPHPFLPPKLASFYFLFFK